MSQSWNGAITNVSASHQTGTICQFLSGPKAPGWHDYAPLPHAKMVRVALGSYQKKGTEIAIE
jgi:hypothetical protein